RSVRVKLIVASDFQWVFDAFKSPETLNSIPPNIMRAILHRSYDLVRSDLPRTKLEVDFDFLERKLENQDEFAELFGITTISNPSLVSAKFPYSITELGKKMGGNGWHAADSLMKIVKRDTGVDIKKGDTKFHQKMKVNNTEFHKYSEEALELLERVKNAGKCEPDWLE
ncbi:MAG: hypothetical protein RLN85_16705, partial [Pseudomonadales bacterium]